MKKYVTVSAFVLSAVLITLGVTMHQYKDVLIKAINICLECIGIG